MNKERVKSTISEIHLYNNKLEALIKVVIWIIAWIGGIIVILDVENKEVLGSAYFIYMLSLLMEFAPQIQEKKRLGSKLSHTLLCFAMAVVCLLSVSVILGTKLSETGYNIMSILTIVVVVYMVIDVFVLWIEPENDSAIFCNNCNVAVESEQVSKFIENLFKGNLGNIDGGTESNE